MDVYLLIFFWTETAETRGVFVFLVFLQQLCVMDIFWLKQLMKFFSVLSLLNVLPYLLEFFCTFS